MTRLDETEISKVILNAYHDRLMDRVVSDVIIVGAGPAGLVAGFRLARQGLKVTIVEKRLAAGGGIWGGGMGMNIAVVQQEALPVLDETGIGYQQKAEGLYAVDAIELAAGLCCSAVRAGAALFNLVAVEDLCVQQGRVTGVVVNRTMISGALPVDPIVLASRAVIDATGHESVLVESLRKRGLLPTLPDGRLPVEGPMDADSGERFVVEHVQEVFPGLWLTGMSVCATLGGPRMGPIFGGMLLSGQNVAQQIATALQA
jgi:thiamine thiazole synthase